MPKDLERDLGLYATITISMGAMIGSGIFVLPGKAFKFAGPSVILAYFLAGVIVLPAALSKSEMATAMPEAGGTYLYIDRAMGPLMGTIAGIGAWFSLVFKSSFALVGLGFYLLIFVELPKFAVTVLSFTFVLDGFKLVGLGLAALLIAVNIVGVKQTGRLQAIIVTIVLLVLGFFVADGLTYVESTSYHPFFDSGTGGLLKATGFVFVSYAGVTKIASVAEEVEKPGKNIPLGILISISVMMLIYVLIVFVVVGVTDPKTLKGTFTPMAEAADSFMPDTAYLVVVGIAILALTSMANAGILSSSRYPLAMSRDALAPRELGEISERFKTPIQAIGLTGSILIALIVFIPVIELAKLASAFQILVFSIINLALIAFRESGLRSYEPEFIAPGYPWVQIFGILGGLVLLTQMGLIPIMGAVGIIVTGVIWYQVYGREKTEREGAALDAIRRSVEERTVAKTEEFFYETGNDDILIAMGPETTRNGERTMLRIAANVARARDCRIHTIRFEQVPEQVNLSAAAGDVRPADEKFERQTEELIDELPSDAEVKVGEIVSHDRRRSVINYIKENDIDVLLGEWVTDVWHAEMLGTDVDWFMNNAPCRVMFVRDRGYPDIREIAVMAQRGPYSPFKIGIANAIAERENAKIRFVTPLNESVTDEQVESTEQFHRDLDEICTVPTEGEIVRGDNVVKGLTKAARGADLVVIETVSQIIIRDIVLGNSTREIAENVDSTVVLVHPHKTRRQTFLRKILEKLVY